MDMDMQVSVGSPPGHGHSDIGHAGVSGQSPLDADSRTLDTQVSVDSPPWTRTFGHWTHRCQWAYFLMGVFKYAWKCCFLPKLLSVASLAI